MTPTTDRSARLAALREPLAQGGDEATAHALLRGRFGVRHAARRAAMIATAQRQLSGEHVADWQRGRPAARRWFVVAGGLIFVYARESDARRTARLDGNAQVFDDEAAARAAVENADPAVALTAEGMRQAAKLM